MVGHDVAKRERERDRERERERDDGDESDARGEKLVSIGNSASGI